MRQHDSKCVLLTVRALGLHALGRFDLPPPCTAGLLCGAVCNTPLSTYAGVRATPDEETAYNISTTQ